MTVVVHVDDFLSVGGESLMWLCGTLKEEHELNSKLLEPGTTREVKCPNRVLRKGVQGLASQPRGMLMFPCGRVESPLHTWMDSDWLGGASSRRSCS